MAVTLSGVPQSGGVDSLVGCFTATLVSGGAVGDLELIACTTQAAGAFAATPSGWTLGTVCRDNSGTDTRVFWRIRRAGDPRTVSIALSGGKSYCGWVTSAYAGTNSVKPLGVPTVSSMTTSGTSLPVAGLKTTAPGSYVVAVAGIGSGSTKFIRMPSGMTQVVSSTHKATVIAGAAVTTPITLTASSFGLSASCRGAATHFEILASAVRPPVADAGTSQAVEPWASAALSSAKSTAGTYPIATYAWIQRSGTPVTLSSSAAAAPTFAAPASREGDTLMFGLVVTDTQGMSSVECTVSVTTLPATEFIQSAGVWVPLQTTVL